MKALNNLYIPAHHYNVIARSHVLRSTYCVHGTGEHRPIMGLLVGSTD